MNKSKSTKLRAVKVSIEGHYEAGKTARGNRRVWVPEQLVVTCGCGTKMRPAEYPNVCECGTDHTALVHEMELILAKNSISLQCRDHEGERSTRVVYKPDDILRALTREKSKAPRANAAAHAADAPSRSASSSATQDNEASLSFCLEDAIVVGNLDLKHHTIERPMVARDCWFMGTVDLRYCEFEQAVYFLDCTFFQVFNSGDTTESYTIYRKELNCGGSRFKKAASFNGIQVESTAYFHNSRFELEEPEKSLEYPSLSEKYTVDFTAATFGDQLECDEAVFEGYVSFNSISCGSNGHFVSACFEKGANFTAASFDWNFECIGAKFKEPTLFNSLRCEGSGRFDEVCFKEKADFTAASFSRNFDCEGAEFREPAIFNSLRCGGIGLLNSVHFRKRVDLSYSSWKAPLLCRDSEFCGEVDCSGLNCTRDGSFMKTRFESDERVVFAGANFGGDLHFEDGLFRGRVDFRALECGGSGHFENATFVNTNALVDYRHSRFGGNLDLRCAYFAGRVRLSQASIKNKLCLGASRFEGEVELYDSDIKILELIDANYHLDKQNPLRSRNTAERGDFAKIVETEDDLERKFKKGALTRTASVLKLETPRIRERQSIVKGLYPFKLGKVTLTGITFERFHGGPNRELAWDLAIRFVEGQDRTRFSRDPYLQLEKYYSSIGEDSYALDVNYKGHCAIRKNAKAFKRNPQEGRVDWSRARIWGPDFIWKWTTGYGQKCFVSS